MFDFSWNGKFKLILKAINSIWLLFFPHLWPVNIWYFMLASNWTVNIKIKCFICLRLSWYFLSHKNFHRKSEIVMSFSSSSVFFYHFCSSSPDISLNMDFQSPFITYGNLRIFIFLVENIKCSCGFKRRKSYYHITNCDQF